jgi:hypothetical protein
MSNAQVQWDLTPTEAAALDDLRANCGLRSRADAVRTALTVLQRVRGESMLDRNVVSLGHEGVSDLVVPGITLRVYMGGS